MDSSTLLIRDAPSPLGRGLGAAARAALLATLVLAPTVFGGLHRYGDLDLLLLVCLLLALWVVSSLLGRPLMHVRALANPFLWALLALLLLQCVPLPRFGPIGQEPASLGVVRQCLVNAGYERPASAAPRLPVGRYSLDPTATVGVLLLAASAAGLYWCVGSALVRRKPLRRAMGAALAGLSLIAFWVLVGGGVVKSTGGWPAAVLLLNPGGDALVPALLAAVALGTAMVLRPSASMPWRQASHRQYHMRWLFHPTVVWAAVAWVAVLLASAALGRCHVPFALALVCALIAMGFAGVGYLGASARATPRRAPGLLAALVVSVVVAMALGDAFGGPDLPAAGADDSVRALLASLPGRRFFGMGAGTLSPSATFAAAATGAAADGDTSGYLVLLVEGGAVGLALILGWAAAFAMDSLRAWRRARSPWTRLVPLAGLGALGANLVYLAFDSSALLAPNLLALAGVFGLVVAWGVHGQLWRPLRRRLASAHWAFVVGAVGLVGVLGVAEQDMFGSAPAEVSDKLVHFAAFAAISLLVCYALGPQAATRHLLARILAAVTATAALGVAVEYGQAFLASTRVFESSDIVANVLGAGLMGVLWWVFRRAGVGAAA